VLFTTLDVTDSARVESALRERTAALEEADRIKTAFVSNISYELRTPLTSIAGFAEMMEAGYAGELPGNARDYVGAILTSVGRLSTLIDDILDLTQSDTGSLLLAEEEVDVAEMVESLLDQARELAEAKDIRFSSVLQPSAGIVTGDRRRLCQALMNLLRNAVQFTPEGGAVRLSCDGDAAGRGSSSPTAARHPAADQTRIFDRFQRSDTGRDGARGGRRGPGLPLARQFIEAHGGHDRAEVRAGAGERVHDLPAAHGRATGRLSQGARGGGAGVSAIALPDAAATDAFGRALAPLLRAGDSIALFGHAGGGQDQPVPRHPAGTWLSGRGAEPDFPDRAELCAARDAAAGLARRPLPGGTGRRAGGIGARRGAV
jgi:hypothetical protein